MKHKELTDTQWVWLQPLLPPQKPKTSRPSSDHRRIINGILWILRTGAP
jgi:transposase